MPHAPTIWANQEDPIITEMEKGEEGQEGRDLALCLSEKPEKGRAEPCFPVGHLPDAQLRAPTLTRSDTPRAGMCHPLLAHRAPLCSLAFSFQESNPAPTLESGSFPSAMSSEDQRESHGILVKGRRWDIRGSSVGSPRNDPLIAELGLSPEHRARSQL